MRKGLLFFALHIFCRLAGQQDTTAVYDNSPIQSKEISDDFLQKYLDDKAYQYDIIKQDPTWWDDLKSWLGNLLMRILEAIFGVEQASGVFSILLEVLPYLLLALLVFLLIKFFLKLNAQSLTTRAKKGEVILSEEERIIKTEDIGQLIKKALSEKNYRLAVRYYYLQVLKQLSEKDYIDWQLQKTNSDYLTELEQEHLKSQFARITTLYDYIWYGDFTIDEAKFLKAEASFKNLQKSLLGHG